MNKIEKAIHCLKVNTDKEVCEECDDYEFCDHENQKAIAQTAIKALEKQIPKKVTNINDDIGVFTCPNCGEWIMHLDDKDSNKYCFECGQKLDWSVEE